MITQLFSKLPVGFKADDAGDWQATIHWVVDGDADQTLLIADGACSVQEGLEGDPSCTITLDADTLLEVLKGELDPTAAFMTGRALADNMGDLMQLAVVFDFEVITEAVNAMAAPVADAEAEEAPAAEGGDELPFETRAFAVMPAGYSADAAPGWDAVVHWKVDGGQDQTVTIADGVCTVAVGLVGDATCTIDIPRDVLVQVLVGELDATAVFMTGQAMADNMGDLMQMAVAFDFEAITEAYKG